MKNKADRLKNPPLLMVVFLLVAAFSVYGLFHTENAAGKRSCFLILLLAVILGVETQRTIEIDTASLRFCVFGICYRRILWRQVRQVGILAAGKGTKGYQPYIYFVLQGAEVFAPGRDDPDRFVYQNPRQTFKLPASHKNIEAIKKYYGKLDFIFPDALRSALNPADKYADR